MTTSMTARTAHGRGVLTDGAFTKVPRWTRVPVPGTAEHETVLPEHLPAVLRRLADTLRVPLSSVLLTAHAKVLAVLSGDHEVATGYLAERGGTPLPCRLTTAAASWRGLVLDTHRTEVELLEHRRFPAGASGPEAGPDGESPETVFDLPGEDGSPVGDTVLWVALARHDGREVLRLRYRTDVLDEDCAARIGGYYVTALTLLADDPEAEHRRQSLLSAEELRLQLEGLAGPVRRLPDRRFHEVFEQRVRAHPDAVAAVHGSRRWTYRELNARANRLAHALLARGLGREDVVAVVTERNLEWMAAVIAIFKAGGVYLPVEPHFPPGRIALMLSRAGCRQVLTEPGSSAGLDRALASVPGGVQALFIDAVCGASHADSDPGVRVGPDQLAYIYFTSGSTGEPKGAMCEHLGMLNHLYAKIDDLAIGEGQVVAQTAPQCFDISLWQLLSALLVGGRTLLVEQAAVLDVGRFIDTVADGRATVLQVVPSYLDVVLSSLAQRPRELPDLRCVSVTGEALKKELVQRWFTARPGIRLVNAYGLTETSDDTNHEVMDGVPDSERIPLGRPVSNVRVYVVDEHLAPVPLGAPGEIVFSGVCVGRGYINDPERTRQSFLPDPHHPGRRLFRAGDHGRWLPEGKLEFLGRRDSQVKIRGFRIEMGEIENALLRVPGVGDGTVVVTQRAGQGKRLVAFYSGRQSLEADVLRGRLGELLPEYMVPSVFLWRESLPLTANGKIDKKALEALAGGLDAVEDTYHAPRTPTERRLAAAWSEVLGIPQDRISRQDNFFDCGGTSLAAVELAVSLDRVISVKDVTRHPVLAALARQVDGGSGRRPGILRPLSEPGDAQAGSLVCFPCVRGNTGEFQALAEALRRSGPALYAVALPVSGTAAAEEPCVPVAQVAEQIAEQVADEIIGLGLTGLRLWGQSSGTAFAVATAKRLEQRGVEVRRLFLGAQLLGDAVDTTPAVRLSAPVTVVVAADDPHTAEFPRRYLDWRQLAECVDLHELPDGGHFFLQTRANDAAQAVRCDIARPASSRAAPERRNAMVSSLPISLPELEREPGKPPLLRAGAADSAAHWAAERRDALRAVVAEHGAVLVRGLGMSDPAQVGAVLQGMDVAPLSEREAFAARQTYSEGVYSSSKWPPSQPMCMHHELSYTLEFPGLMLFACLSAPTSGGTTAVADSAAVLDALPPALTERFEREGWLLTRSYHPEIGATLDQAFGTEDRDAVERYCRAHAIEFTWQPDGGLRTRQRRSAVVRHPVSGRRCWFNQIAFLNAWTMAPEVRDYLIDEYGPDGLPFNTHYGNGDPLTEDVVQLLNEVYEAHTARRPWEAGDLLLVDNVRTAHSREPFEGPRDVVVALADPVRLADCSPTVEVTLP
ncbi:amino acid adenylation domain-containing protein [Streptomyces sp. NEAU-S7GS2]|uniref:amino acid adenylation domain-containing protein n=1 Tax=Streptomyces sp. NEAU-S7GS2 TaxID=2202000 RepID=UPI001EF42942|nr:amino acid adenylation domain-containing protein [Streptomyces sp. NEAU-S7GS2]